jgi:hypothetical protein
MNKATLEQLPPVNGGRIDQDSPTAAGSVLRLLGLVAFFATQGDDGADGEQVFHVRH